MANHHGRIVLDHAEDDDYVDGWCQHLQREVALPMGVLRHAQFVGWRDLRAPLLGGRHSGVSDPILALFGGGANIKQFKFTVGNEVMIAFHIDHDVLRGSTMYPHIHWATDGSSTNSVRWELNMNVALRNDVTADAFDSESQIIFEDDASAVVWGHQVTEDAVGFLAPEVDSLLLCHLKRVTNGATENTDDVFGLFLDIHYEADRYGTPSRAPDYYTAT